MTLPLFPHTGRYYPAIVRDRFDSPIDALIALGVPSDEATDLVAASWRECGAGSIVTTIPGGRQVAVLAVSSGRWAACAVFLEAHCATQRDAERRLARLLKPGTRGTASVLSLVAGELSLAM
jgi:hypothetical protein